MLWEPAGEVGVTRIGGGCRDFGRSGSKVGLDGAIPYRRGGRDRGPEG